MTPSSFVKDLQQLEFDHVFNPYTDRCPVHDREDAPERRAGNLLSVLEAAAGRPVDALWIGRDYSYRGGRRTGLAFTDDERLDEHARRWELTLRRPTWGAVVRERSANVVWNVLSRIRATVFLWNVFPFHPHQPDSPLQQSIAYRRGTPVRSIPVRATGPASGTVRSHRHWKRRGKGGAEASGTGGGREGAPSQLRGTVRVPGRHGGVLRTPVNTIYRS